LKCSRNQRALDLLRATASFLEIAMSHRLQARENDGLARDSQAPHDTL